LSTPDRHRIEDHPLASLFRRGSARSRRASSYDRSGRNADFLQIAAGETADLLRVGGPGCVTRLYCAMILPDLADHRNAVLRCYWDGRERPSVEVPLGDFFALAHGRVREMSSALVAVAPGFGSSYGFTAGTARTSTPRCADSSKRRRPSSCGTRSDSDASCCDGSEAGAERPT
jgi:hypothetical protein